MNLNEKTGWYPLKFITCTMPCEVVFYDKKNSDLQLRLIMEFRQAMQLMDQRYRDQQLPAQGAKILSL